MCVYSVPVVSLPTDPVCVCSVPVVSLPTDPVRPIPSVPQSSASPGPTSEQSTQDMKVTAKPLTNGLSMGTDGLSAIAEYWGLMYTCTYSKPSHSSRGTYVYTPTISTCVCAYAHICGISQKLLTFLRVRLRRLSQIYMELGCGKLQIRSLSSADYRG